MDLVDGSTINLLEWLKEDLGVAKMGHRLKLARAILGAFTHAAGKEGGEGEEGEDVEERG
jgi:hypothetical protein